MSFGNRTELSSLLEQLSPKEQQVIKKYAKVLNTSPSQLLKSKTLFHKLFQVVSLDDIYTIYTIYHKLGLYEQFPYIIENSFQIPLHQNAYLLTPQGPLHITLERVEKNYLLWKIPHKSFEIPYKPDEKITIVFENRHNIAYKMEVVFLGELSFKEGTYLKTSHSFYVETINKRKYPRLKTDIPAMIKKDGNLRDNPFYTCRILNITQKGIQIAIKDSIFEEHDKVLCRFALDSKKIEVKGEIVYKKEQKDYFLYGIKFLEMPSSTNFIITHYIQTYQHKQQDLV